MREFIIVYVTASSKDEADRLASHMVEKRLAACVQVSGPVTSRYWWDGALDTSDEWLCVMKSAGDLFEDLEIEIKSLHSYDVPQIVAVPIVKGSADYLKWLDDELKR